ncbi:hypothetical protein [Vibrio sp. McD22-P3]|uniref:hypothetical protein n=1 Tax=Vibrio sp. McD22-P3 TaxID=2724880 RepID=UPI001F165453|nr:hypothetical protein [Vibrio sp. McD22-P3]MCF4174888.1 hypothetical protein [Vibrio sp. McD22-P3]
MNSFNINEHKIANVHYIDANPYRFTYVRDSDVNDDTTIAHLDIPIELRDAGLFEAIAAFSKTRKFTAFASGHQQAYKSLLCLLIDCFSGNPSLIQSFDDRAISVHFMKYLKSSNKSSNRIKSVISLVRVVLEYANDELGSFKKSRHYNPYLAQLLANLPNVKVTEKIPKKTLSDVFDTDYTDEEILISLRNVLTWFLTSMSDIRKRYLAVNHDMAVDIFHTLDNGKLAHSNSVMKMDANSGRHSCFTLNQTNGYHLRALLDLKCSMVNEIVFYSSRSFRKKLINSELYNVWQIRRELEANFFKPIHKRFVKGDVDRTNFLRNRHKSKLMGNKVIASVRNHTLPIGFMFTSSLAERKALAWLLASDRVQPSGFDYIQFSDVMLDGFNQKNEPNKIQYKYGKGRAGRPFVTPIYNKHEDEIFDVYYDFYQLRMREDQYLSAVERMDYLMPNRYGKLHQAPNAICQTTHLPLILLGVKGTEMQKRCLKEVSNAQPFLDILEQSVTQSTQWRDQRSIYKTHGTPPVTGRNLPISMDVIAQTRAVMEEDEFDDAAVSAELCAHSEETHQAVYVDRSDISKKPEAEIYSFGANVGSKMYDLAKKMGDLVDRQPTASKTLILSELGLEHGVSKTLEGSSEFNDLLFKAQQTGLGTGLVGSMNTSSETLIVQDPTIAAIIISFGDHLDRVKSKLDASSVEFKLLVSHQLYLESLLERFHRKNIQLAREIAQDLKLPYRSRI